MTRYTPTRKVTGQAVGGAVATLAVMTAGMVWPGLEFPAGYEGALAVVLGFVVGWLVPERDQKKG